MGYVHSGWMEKIPDTVKTILKYNLVVHLFSEVSFLTLLKISLRFNRISGYSKLLRKIRSVVRNTAIQRKYPF